MHGSVGKTVTAEAAPRRVYTESVDKKSIQRARADYGFAGVGSGDALRLPPAARIVVGVYTGGADGANSMGHAPAVGTLDGCGAGTAVGRGSGAGVGRGTGPCVGRWVGERSNVGRGNGCADGRGVGAARGAGLGTGTGCDVGCGVGRGRGACVGS